MKLLLLFLVLYGNQVNPAIHFNLNDLEFLRTTSVFTPVSKIPGQNHEIYDEVPYNTFLTKVTAGVLPRGKKGKPNFIRLPDLGSLNSLRHKERSKYSILSPRRLDDNDAVILYVKKPTYSKPGFTEKDLKKLYSELFNEKGMVYITKPVVDEDRKLNALLNKVVEYNTEEDENILRQPVSKVFEKDELKTLETILEALNGKDGPTTPKSIYEFKELVA